MSQLGMSSSMMNVIEVSLSEPHTSKLIASSPGPSQILSRSRGEKSGKGLGVKLRHGPEMVESVCTNRVHHKAR